MSTGDPKSPNNASKPPMTNQGVGAPPFRPSGAFMPPHRPPWGPPPAGSGYFPPYQGGGVAPFPHRPPMMPQQQPPRPVSSKPITGTDWLEVTNDNGTKFWHNTATNQGVWQIPSEVKAASRAPPPLDAAKLKMLERARASGAVVAPQYKAAGKGDKGLLLLEGGGAAGSKTKKGGKESRNAAGAAEEKNAKQVEEEDEEEEEFDVTFTEEDVIGDAKEEEKGGKSAAPLPPPSGPPPPPSADAIRQNNEKDAAIEAAFRDLLKENCIHGFSRYEKELPKLQSDPRFKALSPPERRRTVFEEYCSTVGLAGASKPSVTTKEKKKQVVKGGGGGGSSGSYNKTKSTNPAVGGGSGDARKKAAEDAFKALLQERVINPDVRWYRFKEDLQKDSRFGDTILSEERKEEIFRAHVNSLIRLEEARERAARRTQHAKHAGEERQRYAQASVAEQNFKVLLGEAVREESADWESTWQRLKRDPQGRATDPMLDIHIAERMFRDHVAHLKTAGGGGLEEEEGRIELGETGAGGGGVVEGMDPAYARAYLEGRDAKRAKRDT